MTARKRPVKRAAPKKRTTHTVRRYRFKPGAAEFPLMVVISFVYVCNARCPQCPYNNSAIREAYQDALFMAPAIFKRVADECAEHGAVLRVSGGGEPMLHPKALELLRYAKRVGAKVGLITNGSRFTQKSLEALVGDGVEAIEFSVDAGTADEYARVRPGLDWKRLLRNVAMARDLRDRLRSPTALVASIINQQGTDVPAAERFWAERVDKVQVRKFLTWGYNEARSADPTPYLPPEQNVPCPWLFERLNVDSRGDVTLCGEDIAFSEKFANVTTRTIKEIWHGPEFQRLRELHLSGRGRDIAICGRCPDWQYRSWRYNYWKVLRDADRRRREG